MNIFKLIGVLLYGVALQSIAQDIVLSKPASRIISLSPHLTELLFAAGGENRIVGVTAYSDFPEAAQRITVIGDSRELDLERIISLKPDLIVAWQQGSSARQLAQLKKLAIPVYISDERRLADIPNNIEKLGRLMGTQQQANKAAAKLRSQLVALNKQYASLPKLRVFYQVWDKPLLTLNDQHIVSDAIRVCGGINIFANQSVIAPSVSIEAVLKENPEVIVGTSDQSDGVKMWKRYPTLLAVQRGNLVELDSDLINRAGPRMIFGVTDLCRKLDEVRNNL